MKGWNGVEGDSISLMLETRSEFVILPKIKETGSCSTDSLVLQFE